MSNRYNQSNISDVNNKKVFFDANILIYLFWATGSSWEESYANIYSRLNKQQNKYIIDFIVISEFINRAIRIEYDKYREEYNLSKRDYSFKKYRNSSDGQEVLKDIYEIVSSEILDTFELVEKTYSKEYIQSLLVVDNLDFGDKIILQICNDNNYVLLTNDADFKESTIDILSCNKNLK